MLFDTVNAATSSSQILHNNMEFWDFVLLTISIFVLVSGVLSIVFILWWGILLILSWWKEDKSVPALNTIRYAIIGMVVTVLTIFVFPILGKLLWLDVKKYAEPQKIFEKIEQLWNTIFWNWWSNTLNNSIDDLDTIPSDFSDL